MFKVYVASLYLPQKAADLAGVLAKSPRRIQLNILRTLSGDQLVDALNEGLAENNTAAELAAVKPQVDSVGDNHEVVEGGQGEGCHHSRFRGRCDADRVERRSQGDHRRRRVSTRR